MKQPRSVFNVGQKRLLSVGGRITSKHVIILIQSVYMQIQFFFYHKTGSNLLLMLFYC